MKHRIFYYLAAVACLLTHPVFAITLGQVMIMDKAHHPQYVTYEMINDYAIAEGDIIIGTKSSLARRHASILSKVGGNLWSQGLMPFELSEELPLANKLAVLQAMTLWQNKTNVRFVELTSDNRNNYPDYVSFVPASGRTCASYVGRLGGKQLIVLAPRCDTMNTVHEIGHALGLWHEQSRADRDSYVQIIWENIKEEHRFNFEQHLSAGEDFGAYDYDSIMHYPPTAFSKNGLKTIIPILGDVDIGQRTHLSEKDIAATNAMYSNFPQESPDLW